MVTNLKLKKKRKTYYTKQTSSIACVNDPLQRVLPGRVLSGNERLLKTLKFQAIFKPSNSFITFKKVIGEWGLGQLIKSLSVT